MLPAAILCGGLATRLRPRTEHVPKSLLMVAGEPFLAHQLRLLRNNGIREVVLCAGYLGEQIEAFAGSGSRFGLRVQYSFDGKIPLGTAGALAQAVPLLGSEFLVLYGDSYLPCDYAEVAKAFRTSGKRGLMTVFRNDGQFDKSNVEYKDGLLLRYDKQAPTPGMRYIDYGLGAFRSDVFDACARGDLADTYGRLLAGNELAGFEIFQRFYEIGSACGIADTELFLEGGTPRAENVQQSGGRS